MPFPASQIERLRDLIPLDLEPFSLIPENPAVLEAHLRPVGENAGEKTGDKRCDLVVGYHAARLAEFDEYVDSVLQASGAADAQAAWQSFRTSVPTERILDAGFQLSADLQRLQLYLRGTFDSESLIGALEGPCAVTPLVVRNSLTLFSPARIDMAALDLDLSAASKRSAAGGLYLAVPNNDDRDMESLIELIGFLIHALLRDRLSAEQWDAVARRFLPSPVPEFVYVSFEPVEQPGSIKIDVSRRPLALVTSLGQQLGVETRSIVSEAEARGWTSLDHLGIRFRPQGASLSIYQSLVE